MNIKKHYFLGLFSIFFGVLHTYAEPPIIKIGEGIGQGNPLNFAQFEPFIAEYSGFKTNGSNNDLWVGLVQDNTFIWSQEYKGKIDSKYSIESYAYLCLGIF